MGYYGHMGGIGFGFGWIFMIIFWIAITFAIIALIRGFSGHGCWHNLGEHHKEEGNKALDILKERYAKGEITKEDFDKMKKDLE
jgi:putative membrane protein